jgi:NAD(P)-dependent dehydrogenase (short-subunit alcohol dehydrogenase family)
MEKTVLITGANKGIGREVACQLAAKGFHVFVGARNRDAGRKAAAEIAKKGGKVTFLEIESPIMRASPPLRVSSRKLRTIWMSW